MAFPAWSPASSLLTVKLGVLTMMSAVAEAATQLKVRIDPDRVLAEQVLIAPDGRAVLLVGAAALGGKVRGRSRKRSRPRRGQARRPRRSTHGAGSGS